MANMIYMAYWSLKWTCTLISLIFPWSTFVPAWLSQWFIYQLPSTQPSSPARLSLSSTLGIIFSLKSQSRLSIVNSACFGRRPVRTWMVWHTSGATLMRSPKFFSTSWIEVCSTILRHTNRAKCMWSFLSAKLRCWKRHLLALLFTEYLNIFVYYMFQYNKLA